MNHPKNEITNFSVHSTILQERKQNNTENKSRKQNIKKYNFLLEAQRNGSLGTS